MNATCLGFDLLVMLGLKARWKLKVEARCRLKRITRCRGRGSSSATARCRLKHER